MVDISKISRLSGVTAPQKTNSASTAGWDSGLKLSVPQAPASTVKNMQVTLERTPQNVTNQNATLSPKQMAEHLSRELAKRTAQNKSIRGKSKNSFERDLSIALDENKDISSLLENADSDTIAEFLAAFQSEMGKHLSGLEFGNIIYDQATIDMLMEKY